MNMWARLSLSKQWYMRCRPLKLEYMHACSNKPTLCQSSIQQSSCSAWWCACCWCCVHYGSLWQTPHWLDIPVRVCIVNVDQLLHCVVFFWHKYFELQWVNGRQHCASIQRLTTEKTHVFLVVWIRWSVPETEKTHVDWHIMVDSVTLRGLERVNGK